MTAPSGSQPSSPRRSRVLAAALLLAVSSLATAVLVIRAAHISSITLPLITVALGGLAAVALVPSLRNAVRLPVVGLLMALVLGAALVEPPPDGADMWVYHQAGRTVVEYGQSPYLHPPNDYLGDPFVQRLGFYRDDPTPFGPGYLAFTSSVATLARDSRTAVRLSYQAMAAAAVVACFLLLRRGGAPAWCIALAVLNPVLIVEVVGQGRSDAYPAAALLLAALLALRRPHLAALAIAFAASIKLPLILALGALCLWMWRRSGLVRAVGVGLAGVVPLALGYAAVGGTVALQPLLDIRDLSNAASVWVFAREQGVAYVFGDISATLGPVGAISTVAAGVGLAFIAIVTLQRLRDRQADALVALPVLAYLLTSPYPTARYLMWVVPVCLLRPRVHPAAIALTLSAAIYTSSAYWAALFAMADGDVLNPSVALDRSLFRVVRALPMLIGLASIASLLLVAVRELGRRPPVAQEGLL